MKCLIDLKSYSVTCSEVLISTSFNLCVWFMHLHPWKVRWRCWVSCSLCHSLSSFLETESQWPPVILSPPTNPSSSPSADITSVHICALLLKTRVPGTQVLTPVQQAPFFPSEPSLYPTAFYFLMQFALSLLMPVPLGFLRSHYLIHSQHLGSYCSNSFSSLSPCD